MERDGSKIISGKECSKSALLAAQEVAYGFQQAIGHLFGIDDKTALADCLLDFFYPLRIEDFAMRKFFLNILQLRTELNLVAGSGGSAVLGPNFATEAAESPTCEVVIVFSIFIVRFSRDLPE